MSDNVDDVLTHYGVKGMRWGKRKNSSGPTESKSFSRNAKIALGIGTGSAALAGAGVAIYLMSKSGNLPAFSRSSKGKKFVEDLLDKETPIASFTTLSPSYLQGKSVQKSLPDNMFMRFDNGLNKYVQDASFGWNPNTNAFGRQDWINLK